MKYQICQEYYNHAERSDSWRSVGDLHTSITEAVVELLVKKAQAEVVLPSEREAARAVVEDLWEDGRIEYGDLFIRVIDDDREVQGLSKSLG